VAISTKIIDFPVIESQKEGLLFALASLKLEVNPDAIVGLDDDNARFGVVDGEAKFDKPCFGKFLGQHSVLVHKTSE
jgi:hypothetical protein